MRLQGGLPPRILFHIPGETLTGAVQGKKASDIEERTARAIDKLPDWNYQFRIRISPITRRLSQKYTNLTGELEIDFLVSRGSQLIPVLVDGEISHYYASWMKEVDAQKTAQINEYMEKYGARPAVRVEYWRLASQAMSDQYYRELLR